MKTKLNLGCGDNWKLYPDYEGVDIVDFGQKYVADVRQVLQEHKPDALDEVMANHFFEHFNQEDLKRIFKGIHRVLKAGGLLRFVVPHKDDPDSWVLSHKTFWNERTIDWFGREESDSIYGFGRWQVKENIKNKSNDLHALLIKI